MKSGRTVKGCGSMRLELHCHSHYSRGRKIPVEAPQSPKSMVISAKEAGLGGIALTDHDTIRGWKQAKEEAKRLGMLFIPGIEISTASGHIVGLGLNSAIKKGLSLDETIDIIRQQGGISVAVHPFDLRGEGVRMDMKKADAAEIFNSINMDKVSNMLAERHARRLGMPMVVGSDAHSNEMIGSSVNILDAHTVSSVLREIKRRRVSFERRYVSAEASVSWSRERMTRSYLSILDYIDKNYSPPKAWLSRHLLNNYVFSPTDDGYWLWRFMARLGFGASGLYARAKMLKYY